MIERQRPFPEEVYYRLTNKPYRIFEYVCLMKLTSSATLALGSTITVFGAPSK